MLLHQCAAVRDCKLRLGGVGVNGGGRCLSASVADEPGVSGTDGLDVFMTGAVVVTVMAVGVPMTSNF
jgi:hypothetical protein